MVRIIGIDPGLRNTGWGLIDVQGSRLAYVGCGSIKTDAATSLAIRLARQGSPEPVVLVGRVVRHQIDDDA